ncbi:butyrophilin subfamily 1 member A1-like [Hoplias malabaricus]|uniref:butyrophilin subfamily 1 member A1-like n=1 Tax=Hoplias malabaricus TaxID=27720 RepID=UPI0034636A24
MGCSFWVFVLPFITCAGALSSQTSITARVGSTAVLPCDCRNVIKEQSPSQSPHVQWRTFSDTVFERSAVELYQGEKYKGRVDVPEDQLLKGNCSLELKEVRAEDEGVYKCSLQVINLQLIQSVELSVEETTETNVNQTSDSSDKRLSPREIAILIAGVILLVLLVLLVAAVFILFRMKKMFGRGGHDVRDNADDNQPGDQENVNEPDGVSSGQLLKEKQSFLTTTS